MIDFDVVTGPGPAEKPREPAPKPATRPQGAGAAVSPPDQTRAPGRASPATPQR
jgi:hypothetical protein